MVVSAPLRLRGEYSYASSEPPNASRQQPAVMVLCTFAPLRQQWLKTLASLTPGIMKMNIRHPISRALLWFAAWMAFGFALVQSATVAVEWWHGRLPQMGWWEWLWLTLLPVLIGIWLRCFSIFRPGCRACVLPDARERRGLGP